MKGIVNIAAIILLGMISLVSLVGIVLLPIYYLLVLYKSKDRIPDIESKLDGTIMKGEQIIAKAIQLRPFAFFHRRLMLATTSSRVIKISRGLFGGFTMEDFQWKDLKDARLEENVLPGICGSNICFDCVMGSQRMRMEVNGLPSDVASIMYRTAQSEEQAWEEKRRVRVIEETRAKSGGVTIGSTQSAPLGSATGGSRSVVDELDQAKKLLDSGAITDAEFNELKSKILSKNF